MSSVFIACTCVFRSTVPGSLLKMFSFGNAEASFRICLRVIHAFIQAISITPLQVHYYYYSEALPTQRGYCVGVSR